jgi:hypothetical protein
MICELLAMVGVTFVFCISAYVFGAMLGMIWRM